MTTSSRAPERILRGGRIVALARSNLAAAAVASDLRSFKGAPGCAGGRV